MRGDAAAVLAVRLRTAGSLPVDAADADVWDELGARLARTGRVLVTVDVGGAQRRLVGWADGEGPAVDHPDIVLADWSPVPLRVFGVVLRACWTDRTAAPFPGRVVSRRTVLRTLGYDPDDAGSSAQAKGFLDTLADAGLVTVVGDEVRLGPIVAAWNLTTIESFRRIYDTLPAAETRP